MTVEKIVEALEARARKLREDYGQVSPHLPIEYINGFEDAAELASSLVGGEGTDVDH